MDEPKIHSPSKKSHKSKKPEKALKIKAEEPPSTPDRDGDTPIPEDGEPYFDDDCPILGDDDEGQFLEEDDGQFLDDFGEDPDPDPEEELKQYNAEEAEAKFRMKLREFRDLHGANSIGTYDSGGKHIVHIVLNPKLLFTYPQALIWRIRKGHSLVLKVACPNFLENTNNITFGAFQTNLLMMDLNAPAEYSLEIHPNLCDQLMGPLIGCAKEWASRSSWRDFDFNENFFAHLTRAAVKAIDFINNSGRKCLICGFVVGTAEPMAAPVVLHDHCWDKYYQTTDLMQWVNLAPKLMDFHIAMTFAYAPYQSATTVPVPDSMKDIFPAGSFPLSTGMQSIANTLPAVSKMKPTTFVPTEKAGQFQYRNPGQHTNHVLTPQEMVFLKWILHSPTVVADSDPTTWHETITSQHQIWMVSPQHVFQFYRERETRKLAHLKGSVFAWIHLDIITTLKFKKGIAYPDLPARVGQYPPPHAYAHGDGVYLAEDTTTFPLPPTAGAYPCYMWPQSELDAPKKVAGQRGPAPVGHYGTPITHMRYILCEVIARDEYFNPNFNGYIVCTKAEDICPLYFVRLEPTLHLKTSEFEEKIPDLVSNFVWEHRIHNIWKIVRWLVMGRQALIWVMEYASVFEQLPEDLTVVIAQVLLDSMFIL